jgi:hypothetical protein
LTAGSTATTITATTPPPAAHPSAESPTSQDRTTSASGIRVEFAGPPVGGHGDGPSCFPSQN